MATVEVPQHMQALALANALRHDRGVLRLRVKAGELPAPDVLVDVPECVRTLTVAAYLTWQTRWGSGRAGRFCARHGIPETKTLGSFTLRQRRRLAGLLIGGEEAHATLLAREANANADRREAALVNAIGREQRQMVAARQDDALTAMARLRGGLDA